MEYAHSVYAHSAKLLYACLELRRTVVCAVPGEIMAIETTR